MKVKLKLALRNLCLRICCGTRPRIQIQPMPSVNNRLEEDAGQSKTPNNDRAENKVSILCSEVRTIFLQKGSTTLNVPAQNGNMTRKVSVLGNLPRKNFAKTTASISQQESSRSFVAKSRFLRENRTGLQLHDIARAQSISFPESYSQSSSLSKNSSKSSQSKRSKSETQCRTIPKQFPAFRILAATREGVDDAHMFAEKNFMSEVTLFLCAVLEYQDLCKNRKCSTQQQHLAFRKIVQDFIVPGSCSEINISGQMRQNVMRLMKPDPFTDQECFFTHLRSQKDRLQVFNGIYSEMEKLFWSNVYSREHFKDNFAQNILDHL